MKIALAQINTKVADFEGNLTKILNFTKDAKLAGADLVVFPELTLTGYPVRDLVDYKWFVDKSEEYLNKLHDLLPKGIAVIVGAVLNGPVKPFNAAVFINNNVRTIQCKKLLPTYDVFDESRNFCSGKQTNVFEFMGKKIGMSVCEDGWADSVSGYEINPIKDLVDRGAELIINISASPFYVGKWKTRRDVFTDLVLKYKTDIVYVNSVGANDSLVFDGSSFVMLKDGVIRVEAYAFAEDIIFYDTESKPCNLPEEHVSPIGEIYEALILGIRDYIVKNGFEKVVIGLSGGIDSAIVAYLATQAIGPENVTGILMPSGYSSSHSVTDAIELANNLKIDYKIKSIANILESYRIELDKAGTEDKDTAFEEIVLKGLAEENTQARIRGTILMAWSNRFNKTMLLSTSNRSESSVGYFTLYGDANGGLAPLGDLLKTQVFELANYINSLHKVSIIPFNTIHKPPSAELSVGQKDSDSLPPYEILDRILTLYLEDRLDAEGIIQNTGFAQATVKKILRMVDINEFKRQQLPMNLKVSKVAFGLGRRMPIARSIN